MALFLHLGQNGIGGELYDLTSGFAVALAGRPKNQTDGLINRPDSINAAQCSGTLMAAINHGSGLSKSHSPCSAATSPMKQPCQPPFCLCLGLHASKRRVLVMQEKLSFGIGLPSYEFQDSRQHHLPFDVHAGSQRKSGMTPLSRFFLPDEPGGAGSNLRPCGQPPDLLRYTLPSRYCDLLTN